MRSVKTARCFLGRRLSRNRATQGFTLLEVLVALALSGIMLVVLTSSYWESSRVQRILAGRVTGMMLGRSKLAELMQGSEKASSGEFAPPYREYRWQSQEEKNDSGAIDVTVTVEWRNGNDPPHRVTLQEYKNPE